MPSLPPAAPCRRDLEVRIERIAALIAGARRLIGEGAPLDLTVLGFATVDLRDAVRTAPAHATEGLAEQVVGLQTALDRLSEELAAASGAAARGVNAATRRSAFRAYDGIPKRSGCHHQRDGRSGAALETPSGGTDPRGGSL